MGCVRMPGGGSGLTVKVPGKPGRLRALLAGATLLAGSGLADGGPAAAVAREAGHPGPRAAALALVLHRGINFSELPGRGPHASALPRGSQSVPEPGNASLLEGVFCTSPANCWAVGTYSPTPEVDLNEVLHWTGSVWKQVSVPSPAGSATGDVSLLFGVRCFAASDCWAVGVYQINGGADLDQALHWNGKKWSVVATPTPGGSLSGDINELFEVVCPSSANCWAAGRYGTQAGSTVLLNQMLHWNGKRWALASVPNPAGSISGDINALNSVRCTSTTNCMAVGTYGTLGSSFNLLNEALRWNGTTWSQVTTPSPGGSASGGAFSELDGLGCTTVTNCWAVGSYGTSPGTSLNQALHWNGSAWSQVTTPEPNGTGSGASQQLIGVTCSSATNCWAVGNYGSTSGSPGFVLNQALHWDGGTWSLADTPEPGGAAGGDLNGLSAARCVSTTECWAVGTARMSSGSQFGQVLHWNGIAWSTG